MPVLSQKRFIREALDAHNELRQRHGAAPLELDDELTRMALDWAENLAQINLLRYSYRTYSKAPAQLAAIGENILRCDLKSTGSIYYSGRNVTQDWYKQEGKYSYDGLFSQDYGNFTQVVWKKTRKVGFAFAITEDAQLYAVANYWPAGNIHGQFSENVEAEYSSLSTKPSTLATQEHRKQASAPASTLASKSGSSKSGNIINSVVKPVAQAVVNSVTNSSDSMQEKFAREALDCHNRCRRKHGVPPLSLNPELSKIALSYARQIASMKKLQHSGAKFKGEPMGENLAWAFDSTLDYYSGEKASMQWYNEIKDHDFQQDSQPDTGHFTQLVWKSTKEVGFGVARASDGSFYAVANYYPAGNFLGRYVINVPRPH